MRSSDGDRPSRAGGHRVLYLITSDISARFLRGQLAYLIDAGYDVHVGVCRSSAPAAFDDGVVVHDLPFEREPSPASDARALLETVRLLREVRPAIVNASTPKAALLGMLASWLCRVGTRVYVVRGLRFETLTGVRRHVFRTVERLTTACATDVVYNSRSLLGLAEQEKAVRCGRGVVLAGGSGNGIDVTRYEQLPSRDEARAALDIPSDATVIGFVGRLTRDKGIVDLIDAFDTIDGTTLLLVGDFEPGDPVPTKTREAIARSRDIVLVPWVDDPRSVYPAMDVLAFPSYREGLPNVPLEAQLCGVPVVAYASTGTIDAVARTDHNALVPVGDVDAMRSALRERSVQGRGTTDSADWVRREFDRQAVWRALVRLYSGR